MDLKLKQIPKNSSTITTRISIPCSEAMRVELEELKRLCGKSVNEKAREFFQALIDQNKNKKAG